jgi:hypothetical protein
MENFPVGVSMVNPWMILMHLGWSATRKSVSLIVIEDFFH